MPEVEDLDGDSRLCRTILEDLDGIAGFQGRALNEALVTLERGVGVRDASSYRLSVIKILGDTTLGSCSGRFAAGVRSPGREYARELASTVSPRSLRIIKRQVYESMSQPLSEALDISVREMMACFCTEDFKEGVAHFLEKRPAAFTGK